MLQLPLLPLSDFFDPQRKHHALRVVDQAMRAYGFFCIRTEHPSVVLQQRVFRAASDYFARSFEEKSSVSNASTYVPTQGMRGYISPRAGAGIASGAAGAPGGRMVHNHPGEVFVVRTEGKKEILKDFPEEYQKLFGRNVWPNVRDFRESCTEYMEHAERLGAELCGIFAETLGITPDFFLRNTMHSPNHVRINHYTYASGSSDSRAIHLGEHTDFGLFAMLAHDGHPGLEVRVGGEWREIDTESGAIIVNGGDVLSIVTNGAWKASLHRVRQPSGAVPSKRTSIAYFINGNHDWRLSCLSGFCDDDNPWKYAACTVGEHLWNRSKNRLQYVH